MAEVRRGPGELDAAGRLVTPDLLQVMRLAKVARCIEVSKVGGMGFENLWYALGAFGRPPGGKLRGIKGVLRLTWLGPYSHRCSSGALFTFLISHRTPCRTKARG
ncbi:hypothetical protein AB5J72_38020 [Streptomyces sp. CG1]|uniref:hypothetical protein n=1 Tax=Streptomyces sp. CG1 TaxID=1287523 RepID=UPI0034E28742